MEPTFGTVIERLAYEPFGKRRFASGSDDPNNTIVPQNTDRGYTNHEHLDELTLVHMNGRVYDPVVGRFMSADPQIQDPMNLQSYNRYAYVMNNPLFYIDPTGYSFWTKLRDYVIKPAIAIAVAVYAPEISAFIGWTGGVSATGMAIAGGGSLALGITSGAVASGMLGGTLIGAIMGGDLRSAVIGGISGGAFGWAGDIGQANGLYGAEHFAAHAAAGCLRRELGGGGCGRGAVSGMAGLEGGRYGFIGAIVAGGTVSVIGGGKFGNGAITGTFGYLFNELLHNGARAAYGETGGLYPQKIDPKGSLYNPENWDTQSAADLSEARSWIAEVQDRNSYVHYAQPSGNNSIEQRQWQLSVDAAANAGDLSPSDVRHFFLRQDGIGTQSLGWAGSSTPYQSFGPFINGGGGDVPRGKKTYIDFYKGVR